MIISQTSPFSGNMVPHVWWWTFTLSSALDGVSCHHRSPIWQYVLEKQPRYYEQQLIQWWYKNTTTSCLSIYQSPGAAPHWVQWPEEVFTLLCLHLLCPCQGWTHCFHLSIRGKHAHISPVRSFHMFYFQKSRFQVTEVVLYRPLVTKGMRTHSYLSLSYISRLPGAGNSFLLHNLGFCPPLVRALWLPTRGWDCNAL